MIKSTQLRIVLFLLVWSANHLADAQSTSQPVAPHALRDNLNPSIAVMVAVLVSVFLFMGFFSIYLHHCSETYITTGNPIGTAVDCSCSPRGIDRELLDTFPILVYSTIKDLKIGKGALECAVCLSEFKDYETLRLLPKCNHVFHPNCIDTWLASHVTCPVCRAKLKPDCGEIAITIPTETIAHEAVDESSVSTAELGAAEEQPVVPNMKEGQRSGSVDGSIGKQNRPPKSRTFGKLVRSHSTGHSLVEPGKNVERYTLRLPEDVRKLILVNHGEIRRAASYDVILPRVGSSRKGYRSDGEGSSRGKRDGTERQTRRLVLSMTPPFVSRAWGSSGTTNASGICSAIPRSWASSSCPLHPP